MNYNLVEETQNEELCDPSFQLVDSCDVPRMRTRKSLIAPNSVGKEPVNELEAGGRNTK
jgi:hypothetical protein